MPGAEGEARSGRRTQTPEPRQFSTIEVRVGRVPGEIKSIVLNGGRTVKDALSGANLSARREDEIRVNGEKSNLEAELSANDTVLLLQKIEGN